MSYGIHTINVHKRLKLDKRANSSNWYARLTLDNGKRIVRSMKTEDFEQAKERALELYYDTRARIKNKLPAQTRKFKHVADFAIQPEPPPLKWSAPIVMKRRTINGHQETQARRDCREVTAG